MSLLAVAGDHEVAGLKPSGKFRAVIDLASQEAPTYKAVIVKAFPHNPAYFTQGLALAGGSLYESTGGYGRSLLARLDLASGRVRKSRSLPARYFGEGLTVLGNRVYQLTWESRVGFVYDRDSFEPLREFFYDSEGWGLTHDGRRLIMSDGTSNLSFLDPDTRGITGRLEVRDHRGPVGKLNELEYVKGEVWANVWPTDRIVRISPLTGRVIGWIDLSGLLKPEDLTGPVDVLNGIAYDPESDRLFVTGKLWPKLFEIRLAPK
ncbi:MAG: glutaminyl-peptide cyclotransferase [Thermodesulfobacteriota bacterium]